MDTNPTQIFTQTWKCQINDVDNNVILSDDPVSVKAVIENGSLTSIIKGETPGVEGSSWEAVIRFERVDPTLASTSTSNPP